MPNVILMNGPSPSGNVGIIQAFFQECINALFGHSQGHPNANTEIRVTYGSKGPHTRHGGSPATGYDIDLTATDDFWAQHIYQFSHEGCHVLAQVQKSHRETQWVEESLCEAASLLILKHMANLGQSGPNENLTLGGEPCSQRFDEYADQFINDPIRQHPDSTFKPWLSTKEQALRNNPDSAESRSVIVIVANKLFPVLMNTESHLGAIQFLNDKPCLPGRDWLANYLYNWQAATLSHYHPFIDEIKQMLVPYEHPHIVKGNELVVRCV